MNKLRVAVVGAGEFGKRHMRAIALSSRAELTAVVDLDAARAAEAAAAYSCEVLPDAGALAGRVDAAVVAVPTIARRQGPAPACFAARAAISASRLAAP